MFQFDASALFANLELPDAISGGSGSPDISLWLGGGIVALILGGILFASFQHWKAGRDFKKRRQIAEQGRHRRLHRDHGRY